MSMWAAGLAMGLMADSDDEELAIICWLQVTGDVASEAAIYKRSETSNHGVPGEIKAPGVVIYTLFLVNNTTEFFNCCY